MTPKVFGVVIAGVALFLAGLVVGIVPGAVVKRTQAASVSPSLVEESVPRFESLETTADGLRLRVEHHRNEDFLTYHVSLPLTSHTYEDVTTLRSDGSANGAFIRDLSEITGVRKAVVRPYEIVLEKAEVFSWGEIQPKAREIILRHTKLQTVEK